MDRLEVSASANNSLSQPFVIMESSDVVKESASQPIIIRKSGQVIKEAASQPNVSAESSQVQYNILFQDPRVWSTKRICTLPP